MNPSKGLAPRMQTNEALRRLLFIFQDQNGSPQAGAPGGPISGKSIGDVIRHAAISPAYQIAAADDTRVGGLLRNLDSLTTIYYGSNPNVTDANGSTLLPNESVPINARGPIYIYAAAGSPIAEFTPVLNT